MNILLALGLVAVGIVSGLAIAYYWFIRAFWDMWR